MINSFTSFGFLPTQKLPTKGKPLFYSQPRSRQHKFIFRMCTFSARRWPIKTLAKSEIKSSNQFGIPLFGKG